MGFPSIILFSSPHHLVALRIRIELVEQSEHPFRLIPRIAGDGLGRRERVCRCDTGRAFGRSEHAAARIRVDLRYTAGQHVGQRGEAPDPYRSSFACISRMELVGIDIVIEGVSLVE